MKNLLLLFLLLWFFPGESAAQPAGVLDSTFNQTGIVNLQITFNQTCFLRVRVQPGDDKSVAFGYYRESPVKWRVLVARFLSDGQPDPSFGTNGFAVPKSFNGVGYDGCLLPDGKIMSVARDLENGTLALIRLLPDGKPDQSFGPDGMVEVNLGVYLDVVTNILVKPDGKILVQATLVDFTSSNWYKDFVAQFHPDGTPDKQYGIDGISLVADPDSIVVNGWALQPDGKLIIVGSIGNKVPELQWYISRLDESGMPDASFGDNGVVIKNIGPAFAEGAFDVLPLPDGKILIGGYGEKSGGFHFTLIRLLPDGTTDNTFGLGGKAQASMDCCYSSIFGLLRQSDGKILACGYAASDLDSLQIAMARFKPNGILDQSFADGGRFILKLPGPIASQRAVTMGMQSDGKVMVAGYTDNVDVIHSAVLFRLYPGVIVGTNAPEQRLFAQLAAFPNPLRGDASIQVRYELPAGMPVSFAMYDLAGRPVATLQDRAWRWEGPHTESLNVPARLPAGQYLLRLETAAGNETLRLIKFD